MTNERLGRASIFLASGTMVSRALGFVKAIVLAAAIGGAGSGANAFAVANQLPNTIFVVVAGGVLSAVIVPLIVRAAGHADGGGAYINKLVTLGLVAVGGATVVATVLAPLLVWFTSGARMPSETLALAIAFAWWCIPQMFFYGMYSLLGEVLNARRVFGPFTWVPVLNNLVALIGLAVLIWLYGADPSGTRSAPSWSPDMVAVLGGSATLGVAVQALVLFFFWRRAGLKFQLDFGWRGMGMRETGKIAGWTFGMLLLTTLAGIVETQVSSVSAGSASQASIAALQNAWLVFMLPHSVITVSIATAYFTRMSEHAAENRLRSVREDLSNAIRGVLLIIMVAAAILIVVAYPFASLFVHEFTLTKAMGDVVIAFVVGLVPFSVLFVVQRTFYALHDTRTPFFFTLFQVVLFTIGAIACIPLPSQYTALGIAVVTTFAGIAQLGLALILLRRQLGSLDGVRMTWAISRSMIALAIPVSVGFILLRLFGGTHPAGFAVSGYVGPIVSMLVIGSVMAVLYFIGLIVMRSPELAAVLRPLLAKVRK